MKPVVDEVEKEFAGRILIIRLNIDDPLGKELAPYYGFEYTPTFIFFDEQGNELWRMVGEFDETRFRAEMSNR